jgi:serine/threonine protein kinase
MENELAAFQAINIPADDLRLDIALGTGGFGTVSRAIRLSTGEILAVKEVKSDSLTMSAWASLYSELATMAELHHRSVLELDLELVGAHVTEPYRIITRFCGGKSLFDRLHKQGSTPILPQKLTVIAYHIARGMAYVHDMRIVHRDLKTMNILLDDDDNAKIADFGLAGSIKDEKDLTGGVGTPHYTAPEVLDRKHYGHKVDVYSFGVMLWEMATGQIPYVNKTHVEIIDIVLNKNGRLPFTADMRKLITACWSRRPSDRPDFKDITSSLSSGLTYFPGCTGITADELEPPIELAYLVQTLKKPACPQFLHIVDFLVGHIHAPPQRDSARRDLRRLATPHVGAGSCFGAARASRVRAILRFEGSAFTPRRRSLSRASSSKCRLLASPTSSIFCRRL